jgi:hypothetical protein
MELSQRLISKVDNIKEKITNKEYIDICNLLKELSTDKKEKDQYRFYVRSFTPVPLYSDKNGDGEIFFKGILLEPYDVDFVSTFKNFAEEDDLHDIVKQLKDGKTLSICEHTLYALTSSRLNHIASSRPKEVQYIDNEFGLGDTHKVSIPSIDVVVSCESVDYQ